MAFNDTFRLSCHAVITNDEGKVLLLKANYGNYQWGLPGGALEPGETIHQALIRECLEELGKWWKSNVSLACIFTRLITHRPSSFAPAWLSPT